MKTKTEILIELAFDDLKSARILYQHKQYRNSYYDFQQAVEKANKALGLINGNITEDDLDNKIRHDQIKIYRAGIVQKQAEVSGMLQTLEPHPSLKKHPLLSKINLTEYEDAIKKSIRAVDRLYNTDLVNIPLNVLEHILSEIKEIEDAELPSISSSSNEKQMMSNLFLDVADFAGRINTPQAAEAKKDYEDLARDDVKIQLMSKAVNESMKVIQDVAFVMYTLCVSAIITVQHSTLPRYPDDYGNNPLDIYTLELPIVSKQGEFMDSFEKALRKLVHLSTRSTVNETT